jgi:hypothetical protein
MRCPHLVAATALSVVLAPAPAAADYTTIAPVRPLTMSDPSGLSVIGLEFQFATWTVVRPPPQAPLDFTNLTFNLTSDITLSPHWLLLVRLPLSDVSIDDDDDPDANCCDLALGNLTLGGRGLWAQILGDNTRGVFGGELTLSVPTASDGVERGGSAVAGAFAHVSHDPGLFAPDTTALRLNFIGQIYRRYFMMHGEIGLQMFYFDNDADDDLDFAFRAAIGAGIRATYKLAILLELNTLLASDDFGDDDSAMSIDFGLRYNNNNMILGARLFLPLDDRRDLDMIGFGLDAGWRF